MWIVGGNFQTPVLVTGLPRSGTSMVMGLLGLCGLWLGRTVPGGRENIRGFFENIILRERLQKRLLHQSGFDPIGVRRLPPAVWRPSVRNFRDVVAAALDAQQYDGSRAWGFKDAKLTLTWRVWHEHFPHARWIVVRRPSDDVVASCLRTRFMKHHSSDPTFWVRFVEAYLERLEALVRTVAWSRSVNSVDIISGRHDPLRQIVTDIGLTWNTEAVRAFVEPTVWHASPTSQSKDAGR
jgi:hypothetical protein